MSKVNVRLNELVATPGNVLVSMESVLIASQSVVRGSIGILPAKFSKRTDVTGCASFVSVETGRYLVSARSTNSTGLAYAVTIDVPNDALEYEHTQLIPPGGGAAPFSQPIVTSSNATDSAFGLVRLSSGGFGIPECVPTIAALKLVASARAAIAGLAFVLGSAAAGDGLGGLYRWDAAGAEANDDAAVVRPSDFAAAGVWKKWL